ncbi:hypothetical protein K491DRAFT_332359 [Lophiostoma macrostomum CBS 122681]|uniref:Tat pathway signal sequence n=1 Tax=Lophiostoma macrostomum CBS 122681 TaxID=1314788 RepID=A0A6A6TTA1_9PLEO|nr:hypothetical protein K491DRAFT_332359 [Lophiostoma macrostomum CBS 122681]
MDFWSRKNNHEQLVEPPAKRISTPAGQRLSVILENGDAAKARESHRASVRKSGLAATLGDAPRESSEGNGSSGYSYSVWSDGEKFAALKNHKQIAKRGGWKRVALILAVLLALIIALAVGLALGLKKKKGGSDSDPSTSSPGQAQATKTSNPDSTNPSDTPTATASLSPSSTPSNFPQGNYSLVTFLDTVATDCTANQATWTCYPYTDYNTSPSKSLATFNWIITSSSSGSYQISSTKNPFSISFTNADLALLDAGQDSERYHFQLENTKTVSPSTNLTDDGASVECEYDNTSLQAFLYTKMQKSYPDTAAGDPGGDPAYPVWPWAVRVEQSVGGGQDVPACHKLSGEQVTEGLDAQDASSLCSCLYKNWRTPST